MSDFFDSSTILIIVLFVVFILFGIGVFVWSWGMINENDRLHRKVYELERKLRQYEDPIKE